MTLLALVAVLLVLLGLVACTDTSASLDDAAPVFVIEVSGEEFRVQVTDPVQATRLEARMASGETGVLSGALLPGSGGFNAPWSWHLDPTTVHAPDSSIELCDGRPGMVEDDLGYWLESVGQFCPWGARVVRRAS
jgi:hypothetical protein